jgi:UPF0755 protein
VARPSALRRIATAAGVLLLLAVAAGATVAYVLAPVDPSGPPRIIVVPKGQTSLQIGERLAAAGLIRAGWGFAAAAQLRRVATRLQEGEYRLSPAMPLLQILDTLARGDVVLHQVTIPEGFTAAEIVDALAGAGIGTPKGLAALVQHGAPTFPYAFLSRTASGSLEGFLFPDTYRIPRYLADRQIVQRFLTRFADVVVPRARALASTRPLYEVITVASLVEREAKIPSERPVIAGVLYNRLARGMKLEVDATVLYALGRHKDVVTLDDLKVDSPYNTYRYAGLPPGPIANPGLASITAALRPADTRYLFYVARADGSHVFSRTFAEHLIAIRKYRGR